MPADGAGVETKRIAGLLTVDLSLTDRASVAVKLARRESRRAGADVVGVEHLLYGLVKEKRGVAASVLKRNLISLPKLRERATESSDLDRRSFRVEEILELSGHEATRLGHPYIGTEHVLFALLTPEPVGNITASVLQALGVDPKALREDILDVLGVHREWRGVGVRPSGQGSIRH